MAVNQIKRNGSYAPLSSRYYKDDAIAQAGPMAELLYVRGLAFCAETLKDGFISETQLRLFVSVGIPNFRKHAEQLTDLGLWEKADRDGGGFIVKSWAKWNLTLAEIQEKQRKDAERKAGIKP